VNIETKDKSVSVNLSSGGLVSAVSSYLEKKEKLDQKEFDGKFWLGVPGCSAASWDKAVNLIPSAGFEYVPVFAKKKSYEAYYNGMSNSVLWALFHYFPSFAEYNNSHYDHYLKVNQDFANTLLPHLQPGDVIWIHDYHLLPLSALIRHAAPEVCIGFFLHIPFPSYEIFRIMPKRWQKELLTGMLGADLVGFHTDDYAEHFLNTAKMVLGLQSNQSYLEWENRKVKTGVFPISIDYDKFHNAFKQREIVELRDLIKSKFDKKKIIFSADRLDYTKGVYNRLRAYELFLKRFPEYHEKVVFIIVIVPSRDAISKYAERKKMIDEYIGNLNSRIGSFHWQPVIYQYSSLNFNELMAMYTSCNLALITPVRDGMNLVAKEFVASRRDKKGVLILSEMTGAAAELIEALSINPTDIDEIAEQIKTGLEMEEKEQAARITAMQSKIKRYDVAEWAGDFLKQLDQVYQMQAKKVASLPPLLDKPQLGNNFLNAKKRLILLDYDGTLTPLVPLPEMAVPDEKLLQLLATLSRNAKNTIFIISGRDSATLENWLGKLDIGLIAEHGAWIKTVNGSWTANSILKTDWKKPVKQLLEHFTESCWGTFIENKTFSLAWHYRNADIEEANLQMDLLVKKLKVFTETMDIDIIQGNKVIEVKNRGINKGQAVSQLINDTKFDFILACGDDTTDEDMFHSLIAEEYAMTIKVGKVVSRAKYRVVNVKEILQILEGLTSAAIEKVPTTQIENF